MDEAKTLMSDGSAYRDAGVDIDAQEEALRRVKERVRSTFTTGVLSDLGNFGGLFRPELSGMTEPLLVASADGVGTKLMVARMAGDYSTVGHDLVNHCVNDILVQGARPLFFLDYVGAGILEPEKMEQLVGGVAAGCEANGCALLGGETAEMPGFYQPGDYELVGFVVGWVDRPALIDGSRVRAGDRLIGLRSNGLHTNGYSLARRVFFDTLGLQVGSAVPIAGDPRTVGELLLAVHRSYLPAVGPLLDSPGLHALAHITGGGLTDNLPRVLPEGLGAVVDRGSWDPPEIFRLLEHHGGVSTEEMFRVFNMGIGMVLIVAEEFAGQILGTLQAQGERPVEIGEVRRAVKNAG